MFISHGVHYQTRQHSIYHARDDEMKIASVVEGPSLAGNILHGDNLEDTAWTQ
jgi:hypothetical protein